MIVHTPTKMALSKLTRHGLKIPESRQATYAIQRTKGEDDKLAVSMPVRECTVSFMDARGVRHSVAVYASSVLEAAAAGLKQIRETEMIEDDGVLDLTVDLVTTTSHRVSLS